MKKYIIISILLIFTAFFANTGLAAEVPFEVVKTKVVAETVVPVNSDVVVVDGVAYSPAAEGENLGYPPPKGEIDSRVKVPITGIKYTLEFWNVGKMGGEKGFIFKSSYEDAKLTISYQTGQAYKNVLSEESFMGLHAQKKVEVSAPDIKDLTFNLTFYGGPYGKFLLNEKDKDRLLVGEVVAGKSVKLHNFNVNNTLIDEDKALLPITNGAFDKWMEILNQESCGPDSPPLKDSGIRFNGFDGEVMVRPDCDEDAWYGAELDMVLHVDDHVRTGDDSTASLGLADLTTFVMKPESEIVLGERKERTKIRMIAGKIWANVKEMVKDGTMTVEMTQAVAGIKGTTFVVEDTGDTSTLKVIDGHVEFTSKTTGKKEMVGTGEMITATKSGLQEKTKLDGEKESVEWNKLKENLKKSKNKSSTAKNKSAKSGSSQALTWVVILLLVATGGFVFWKKKFK